MVHLDDVKRHEWYNYPHRHEGGGTVRVYVVNIWSEGDRQGNRWVKVRLESPTIGWGAVIDISTFCQHASRGGES